MSQSAVKFNSGFYNGKGLRNQDPFPFKHPNRHKDVTSETDSRKTHYDSFSVVFEAKQSKGGIDEAMKGSDGQIKRPNPDPEPDPDNTCPNPTPNPGSNEDTPTPDETDPETPKDKTSNKPEKRPEKPATPSQDAKLLQTGEAAGRVSLLAEIFVGLGLVTPFFKKKKQD